jgi:hypothetical protein
VASNGNVSSVLSELLGTVVILVVPVGEVVVVPDVFPERVFDVLAEVRDAVYPGPRLTCG